MEKNSEDDEFDKWDKVAMSKRSPVEVTWWGEKAGYTYLRCTENFDIQRLDVEAPGAVQPLARQSLCSASLINVLDDHTSDYYESYPHDPEYDVGLDVDLEALEDLALSTDESDYEYASGY